MYRWFCAISLLFSVVPTAIASPYRDAVIDSCMQAECDAHCRSDHALRAAAKLACEESDVSVTIKCPDFSLVAALNGLDALAGADIVDNPIDCNFERTTRGKDLFSCESYQGSPYANLWLSAARVGAGRFQVAVDFQDTSLDDGEPRPIERLRCAVELGL